jgi:hypothetical protein
MNRSIRLEGKFELLGDFRQLPVVARAFRREIVESVLCEAIYDHS